jgi:hypothetical protein
LPTLRKSCSAGPKREDVEPITCYAGYGITMDNKPPAMEKLKANIADGVVAVWLPVFNHANTLNTVGGLVRWWDSSAAPGRSLRTLAVGPRGRARLLHAR